MNYIKKIIEPEFLYLVWQPPKALDPSRQRRIVGKLLRDNSGKITFRYEHGKDLKIALKLGLEKYGPFEDLNEIYDKEVMEIFSRRLPSRKRDDFTDFLRSIRIDPNCWPKCENISDFALLGYSGGYLPQDTFSLVHTFEGIDGDCQLLEEVAGFRYYINTEEANIFMDIALNDQVELVPEPSNLYDTSAVKVIFQGKLIGYINRVMAPTYIRWLSTRAVTAVIEKVIGTIDRPRVMLFISVS